jgi:nitrite reductase (NO-forming)
MAITLERPPSTDERPPSTDHDQDAQAPRRLLDRYQLHLWIGGLSLIVIAAFTAPALLWPAAPTQVSTGNVLAVEPIDIAITASEFRFSPTNIQAAVGQKVTLTLDNTGVVEHDVTIPSIGFTLLAKPGQSASGEFTFDKPGVVDFFCSIPGHKDAGMKGTLTIVNPQAAAAPTPAPAASASNSMAGMPGTTVASGADIKPLPADLKPLGTPQMAPPITRTEPAYVKFNLETTKVTALLASGVAYEYWTFNNTVPGPMLRVREGDTVEIDLSNAVDAGVTHSIDLHAVNGPGGGASVMQIPAGENGSFKFEALTPGVYVYHCATPMVAEHIASGMYGLIVVEPKGGLPQVDHEYYLMQGDFYLQGQRGDEGLRAFDLTKMLDERPDYVLFNGGVGSLSGANALTASVGQSIRVFFGVGGPNLSSSFHVIGTIFDRVYAEGSLTSPPETNVQTTHVSVGGATVVEFTPRVPGTYTIVDHSLARMDKGAAAQIVVDGPPQPEIFQSIKPGSGGSGGH